MIRRLALALSAALIWSALPAWGETYHREELRVPEKSAGPRGLETLFLRPDAPGKYPLVVISHGTPRKPEDRAHMTPWSYYPNAMEFARRGFAVAVVMRRAYGGSGGRYSEGAPSCAQPGHAQAARTAVHDIKAAIAFMAQRPDVDGARVLAVGQSTGGLATVALTADPPPGLMAAINFAGGRGSKADNVVCNEAQLVDAFRTFGKTSRVPMLWVYTANDRYFAPPLADKLHAVFSTAGGQAEYIHAPAYGKDGHSLFSFNGIAKWTPYVDAFLAKHNLAQRATPMALPPLPAVTPPPQLSYRGRQTFLEKYMRGGRHRAFAVSSDGHFGWQTGKRTIEEAKSGAMKYCRSGAKDCRIVFVDDEAVR